MWCSALVPLSLRVCTSLLGLTHHIISLTHEGLLLGCCCCFWGGMDVFAINLPPFSHKNAISLYILFYQKLFTAQQIKCTHTLWHFLYFSKHIELIKTIAEVKHLYLKNFLFDQESGTLFGPVFRITHTYIYLHRVLWSFTSVHAQIMTWIPVSVHHLYKDWGVYFRASPGERSGGQAATAAAAAAQVVSCCRQQHVCCHIASFVFGFPFLPLPLLSSFSPLPSFAPCCLPPLPSFAPAVFLLSLPLLSSFSPFLCPCCLPPLPSFAVFLLSLPLPLRPSFSPFLCPLLSSSSPFLCPCCLPPLPSFAPAVFFSPLPSFAPAVFLLSSPFLSPCCLPSPLSLPLPLLSSFSSLPSFAPAVFLLSSPFLSPCCLPSFLSLPLPLLSSFSPLPLPLLPSFSPLPSLASAAFLLSSPFLCPCCLPSLLSLPLPLLPSFSPLPSFAPCCLFSPLPSFAPLLSCLPTSFPSFITVSLCVLASWELFPYCSFQHMYVCVCVYIYM